MWLHWLFLFPISLSKTQLIIQELLANEKSYVDALKNGINDYIIPFDTVPLPQALSGQRLEIFSNIEVIHEFHENKLLPSLLKCGSDAEQIAEVFTSFIVKNKFDNYIFYVMNRAKSIKICKDNEYFFMQLQKDRLGISSFLLQPVQRLPRYQLMLGELAKELMNDLEMNKEAAARCFDAEKSMQSLLNTVNEYCEWKASHVWHVMIVK